MLAELPEELGRRQLQWRGGWLGWRSSWLLIVRYRSGTMHLLDRLTWKRTDCSAAASHVASASLKL